MPYTPPSGASVELQFKPYTPPAGGSVQLEFSPTGGTQNIYSAGFVLTQFGAPVVSGSAQTVRPTGINLFVLPTQLWVRGPQYIQPGSLDLYSPGLHKVVTYALSPAGLDLLELGAVSVDRNPRLVQPLSWDSLEFNYSDMDVGHDIRYRSVPGFSTLEIGRQWVYRAVISAGDQLTWGVTSVQNFIRTYKPFGFNLLTFGDATWVSNRTQDVKPVGFSPLIVTEPSPKGMYSWITPRVEHSTRYVYPSAISNLTQVGSPMVSYALRPIQAGGMDLLSEVWTEFDYPGSGVRLREGGSIQPLGLDLVEFGDVTTSPKRIYTSGFSTLQFGIPEPRMRSYIVPDGLELSAVGDPAPAVPGTVYRVAVGDGFVLGRPLVRPSVAAGGVDSVEFGDTHIARLIKPAGFDLAVVAGQGVNNEFWCNMWIGANLTAGDQLQIGAPTVSR